MPQPRPLPVIVLADVSGSMSEDGKIDILNNALKSMILSFGAESKLLRAEIQVGLITFGGEVAKEHLPWWRQIELPAWRPSAPKVAPPWGARLRWPASFWKTKRRSQRALIDLCWSWSLMVRLQTTGKNHWPR